MKTPSKLITATTLVFGLALVGCDSGSGSSDPDTAAVADTISGDTTSTPDVPAVTDTAADTAVAPEVVEDTHAVDTTAPADLPGTPDTTVTVDAAQSGPVCQGIELCLADACKDVAKEGLEACLTGAMAACTAGADDVETAAALTLLQCKVEADCGLDPGDPAGLECWRITCLDQTVACSNTAFGAGKCSLIGGCVKGCTDLFGDLDWACVRGCLEEATAEAAKLYWDFDLCIRAVCGTAADYAICTQQASGDPGVCGIPFSNCSGDQG